MPDVPLAIAGRAFRSRLIVGTGKYSSHEVMARAHEASGAEMVTVAVRRVELNRSRESLLDYIDTDRYFLLPNTAGCYTADDAVRAARLGREAGLSNWVKLEVIGDEKTLFPDNEALLEATRVLVGEGFVVLPYTNDDPVTCRKLEDAGAAAVMPLGAPIGSGLGVQNANNIRLIKAAATVPVIVDAGVGTASDAAIAMELGDRRRADEHRHRRRGPPGGNGRGDEPGGTGRAPCLPVGTNPAQALRHRQQPARGRHRHVARGPRQQSRMANPIIPEDELTRLERARKAADRAYNDALTALDRALVPRHGLPDPPRHFDEHVITPLNESWQRRPGAR